MSQKGLSALIIVLGIFIVCGLIVGTSFYIKNKQSASLNQNSESLSSVDQKQINTPSELPKPIVDSNPAASWKLFTDKSNTYSLKYPGEIYIRILCAESKSDLALVRRQTGESVDELSDCSRTPDLEVSSENSEIYKHFSTGRSATEYIKLDGINATKYTFSNGMLIDSGFGDVVINFGLYNPKDSQLFEQIVSTFKLLDRKLVNDIKRLQDLAVLANAIAVSYSESNLDIQKFNIGCKGEDYSSHCFGSSLSDNKSLNGSGWIKMDLTGQKVVPLDELPVDPTNNKSFHYIYCADGNTWEINAVLESPQYLARMKSDGGDDETKYEVGSNLTLIDRNSKCKY